MRPSSFLFLFLFLQRSKPLKTRRARAPNPSPTPIPVVAPLLSPPDSEEEFEESAGAVALGSAEEDELETFFAREFVDEEEGEVAEDEVRLAEEDVVSEEVESAAQLIPGGALKLTKSDLRNSRNFVSS